MQDHVAIEASRLIDDVGRTLESDVASATRAAAHLATLLANACANSPSGPARGGLAPWQMRKVQRCIEGGLENSLPIDGLANLVSLSPSYFCRAFKVSFGVPPHAYIIRNRVERAKTLMLTTSDSLSQIALSAGLADQAHFTRRFRQLTGTTPGDWRRKHASPSQSQPDRQSRSRIAERSSANDDYPNAQRAGELVAFR
jgi:transcriptional regulator GlxA family with amidase domain